MTNEHSSILTKAIEAANGNLIQATFFQLGASQAASRKAQHSERVSKKAEIEILKSFAENNHYWFKKIKQENYIGEGAEQKVYLEDNGKYVLKINDAVFYASWTDYFINLLIHNLLFPATAYQLLGFYQLETAFYAVVKQPFIASTQPTDLLELRSFLQENGFVCKKNNDYFHSELGIILEDLHDANVLTNQGVFFFIDNAIYLIP